MPRPRVLVAAGALALAALTSGCSLGSEAHAENDPNVYSSTAPQLVARTPLPLESDLPYTQPPLVVPIPGPTGGVPGDTPVTAAPFSSAQPQAPTNEGGF